MTTESFNPEEFRRIASLLVLNDSSEASLRTAINRLYYAAFLATRDALGVSGSRTIHGRVSGELRRYDRLAGERLERLFELRRLADYVLDVADPLRTDWQRNYQMARRLANFVLERLR